MGLLFCLVWGCGGGSGGGDAPAGTLTISGTLYSAAGNAVARGTNSSFGSAQTLRAPALLGGFVDAGAQSGRSHFFTVNDLPAHALLRLALPDGTAPDLARVALYLYSLDDTAAPSAEWPHVTPTAALVVDVAGDYYIEVRAKPSDSGRSMAIEHRRRQQATLRLVQSMQARPDVRHAQPNYVRRPLFEPDDPLYPLQWHLDLIQLPAAWGVTRGDAGVIVAVLDTGALLDHPDLRDKWVQGYDFVDDDNDPHDPGDGAAGPSSFHGTHVAGIVAAAFDNAEGVAGVGGATRFMPVRVLGPDGGNDDDIAKAIRWAAGRDLLDADGNVLLSGADPPADIINMSFGAQGSSAILQAAVQDARDAGVILIAAAHMSGVVALMKALRIGLTPDELDGYIACGQITADLAPAGTNAYYGHGLIDAYAAVSAARNDAPPAHLTVLPGVLQLDAYTDNAGLFLRKAGSGDLAVEIHSSPEWLSIASTSETDDGGFGPYQVAVDRPLLAAGQGGGLHTGTLVFETAANMGTVPVTVAVLPDPGASAGIQYLLLIDTATMEPVAQRVLSPVNGSYPFSFTGVRAGNYHLLSGSDLNNHQRITDSGEAVGGYPSITELKVIQVQSDVSGLQFVTGFNQWPFLWPAHAPLDVAVLP